MQAGLSIGKVDYIIREMRLQEYPLLADFLYEAVFRKNTDTPVPRTIIHEPALQVYIKDFGTMSDDYCLCAEVDNRVVGAVWVRNIDGYGSVDEETPEFAISVFREYRGLGIGTDLMRRMLELLREKGYRKASLSVQKENDALRMYRKVGFWTIRETEEEYIMECILENKKGQGEKH